MQHPADDKDSEWITTHFEYHSMEENLLKLDMLGHDDPTMIRMLEDMTGVDAQKIPLDDQDTMSIFTSSKVLGFENDPILGPVGSVAIPEFGTGFTRGMLQETQPTKFDTLIRLSGFSHGTDVWLGNARDLILSKTASVNDAIGCRDDIMLYLIKCGMPEKRSFTVCRVHGPPTGAGAADPSLPPAGLSGGVHPGDGVLRPVCPLGQCHPPGTNGTGVRPKWEALRHAAGFHPPIARVAATKLRALPLPQRLYYDQTVYRAGPAHSGGNREPPSAGWS